MDFRHICAGGISAPISPGVAFALRCVRPGLDVVATEDRIKLRMEAWKLNFLESPFGNRQPSSLEPPPDGRLLGSHIRALNVARISELKTKYELKPTSCGDGGVQPSLSSHVWVQLGRHVRLA